MPKKIFSNSLKFVFCKILKIIQIWCSLTVSIMNRGSNFQQQSHQVTPDCLPVPGAACRSTLIHVKLKGKLRKCKAAVRSSEMHCCLLLFTKEMLLMLRRTNCSLLQRRLLKTDVCSRWTKAIRPLTFLQLRAASYSERQQPQMFRILGILQLFCAAEFCSLFANFTQKTFICKWRSEPCVEIMVLNCVTFLVS